MYFRLSNSSFAICLTCSFLASQSIRNKCNDPKKDRRVQDRLVSARLVRRQAASSKQEECSAATIHHTSIMASMIFGSLSFHDFSNFQDSFQFVLHSNIFKRIFHLFSFLLKTTDCAEIIFCARTSAERFMAEQLAKFHCRAHCAVRFGVF